MPIDRTAFNQLADDDGSGLTGSIWNKAQIKAVLLDPIDAEIVTPDTLAVGSGQIVFPVAANPSTNPNALDDYREGTWTPTFLGSTSGSGTFAPALGEYFKIGRFALVSFYTQVSSKGSAAGNMRIGGLPFPTSNGIGGAMVYPLGGLRTVGLAVAYYFVQAWFAANVSYFDVAGSAGAGGSVPGGPIPLTDVASNSLFMGCLLYPTAS